MLPCCQLTMLWCLWPQVVLSPQRPRTVISFENRCWSSDGMGSKPVLSMFPHTEGAKVRSRLCTGLPGLTADLRCICGSCLIIAAAIVSMS
jgi:hypothetical protein